MYFNETDFKALTKYSAYFNTAVSSAYAHALSSSSIKEIHEAATHIGWDETLDMSCPRCRVRLLQFVGQRWLADEAQSKKVQPKAVIETPPKPQKKARKATKKK